jgi:hypothetical protein
MRLNKASRQDFVPHIMCAERHEQNEVAPAMIAAGADFLQRSALRDEFNDRLRAELFAKRFVRALACAKENA